VVALVWKQSDEQCYKRMKKCLPNSKYIFLTIY
jgi:hypothetical protein